MKVLQLKGYFKLSDDFISFAERLDLPTKNLRHDTIIEMVKNWFEKNERWLLVFDNAEEHKDIVNYLPRRDKGHIIVTTRNQDWAGFPKGLNLDVMELEDAIEFILRRTNKKR